MKPALLEKTKIPLLYYLDLWIELTR